MPAQISHILLGLESLSVVPPGWGELLDKPAFALGCQGPDVFYHNRRTKPGGFLYGTRLHRRGWGTFLSRFRTQALDRGWGPEHPGMAYLVGLAGHGFLDRKGHPFIVTHAGWKVPREPSTDVLRNSHSFLERIIDVLMWPRLTGQPWTMCRWQDHWPGPEAFPSDFWDAWAEVLYGIFPQLSPRPEVEARLKNAVADAKGFLEFTAPRARDQGIRAAQAGALYWFHPEALPEWDFLNLSGTPWPDPLSGEPRTESFPQLFDLALAETKHLLSTLTDAGADWEAMAGNGNLNLPEAEGLPGAPAFSRPWDYAALYERERASRLGPV